jgi:hypothetical protein
MEKVPGLGAILGKGAEPMPDDDVDGDLEMAMEDLAAATKAGDPVRMAAAFKAAHQICGDYGE